MKKLILVLALFVVSLAFGQEENVSFNKKLVYKIDTINSTTVSGFRNIKSINYYHSNNYGLISVSSKYDSYYGNMFTLFDKSRFILVSIDAETRKVILPETINEDDVKINLIKTNEKAVINRVSCNYYQGNLDDKTIIKICVDEKSKINVLKNIFGENINGKILSFGMVKKGREKTTIFNLVEEKDIDFSVKLDNKDIEKAIAENKRKQKIRDSINTVREKEIYLVNLIFFITFVEILNYVRYTYSNGSCCFSSSFGYQ